VELSVVGCRQVGCGGGVRVVEREQNMRMSTAIRRRLHARLIVLRHKSINEMIVRETM